MVLSTPIYTSKWRLQVSSTHFIFYTLHLLHTSFSTHFFILLHFSLDISSSTHFFILLHFSLDISSSFWASWVLG
ncbi:unnamed protein product [Brassica oleracea]